MPIWIKYLKYLFMVPGVIILYIVFADWNWHRSATAVLAIIAGGVLGYGAERVWLYLNRNPGGARWSKFWTGR
jgi:hypothetical protein